MSRICIGVICGIRRAPSYQNILQETAVRNGLWLFCDTSPETFLADYPNDKIIFSIADSSRYDNCEELLLPDGWVYANHTAAEEFAVRAKRIENILLAANHIADLNKTSLELFIGESGNCIGDFITVSVRTEDFAKKLCTLQLFDEKMFPIPYHFLLS